MKWCEKCLASCYFWSSETVCTFEGCGGKLREGQQNYYRALEEMRKPVKKQETKEPKQGKARICA